MLPVPAPWLGNGDSMYLRYSADADPAYNLGMTERDENEAAADAVRHTLASHETPLPADVEAAWAAWSAGVGKVDARVMALLRAAFEVGVEAGRHQRR